MIAKTLAIATLALGVASETTINVLVGTLTSGLAGSIVSASGCDTTVALHCTDQGIPLCAAAPDVTVTVTEGPTSYRLLYATSSAGVAASVSESCDLAGPFGSFTQAVCTGTISISGPGLNTVTATKTTITNTNEFNYAAIPITSGAEKLPTGSGTCTANTTGLPISSSSSGESASTTSGDASPASSGASSTSDSAAAATAVSEVYKIIVPIGAALVAGAGVLI